MAARSSPKRCATALAGRRASGEAAAAEAILADSAASLARLMQPSQRRVFNLTGTVLHTNLGRAPLPEEAIAAAVEAMRAPTTLEYEVEGGRRGERDDHVAGWLKRLTGAEAALAVNNNAGALVLALNALAAGKRDDRLARRADRDRRRVSPARHHGARRHDACARSAPPTARICAITPPRSGRRPG